MYNKEVKLQYIDDCLLNSTTKNPELIRKKNIVFFNKTGKLEKEFGMTLHKQIMRL